MDVCFKTRPSDSPSDGKNMPSGITKGIVENVAGASISAKKEVLKLPGVVSKVGFPLKLIPKVGLLGVRKRVPEYAFLGHAFGSLF